MGFVESLMQNSLLSVFLLNIAVGCIAFALHWITLSGLVAGVAVGTGIGSAGGLEAWGLFAAWVTLGSVLTGVGYRRKMALGAAQERGGRRGAREAVANGVVPLAFAIMASLDSEFGWELAFLGALATATADTTASELGPLVDTKPRDPLRLWRKQPAGSEGAVSIAGTIFGMGSALAIASLAWAIDFVDSRDIIAVTVAATAASYLESILGAYGKPPAPATAIEITERSARPGRNEILNVINTIVGGALSILISRSGIL